jgi:hypothetical protein
MAQQLTRQFNRETFYCEGIENSLYQAKQAAKRMRSSGKDGVQTRVRVVQISVFGQPKYGLFCRSDW